jgi:hypothetical protein
LTSYYYYDYLSTMSQLLHIMKQRPCLYHWAAVKIK